MIARSLITLILALSLSSAEHGAVVGIVVDANGNPAAEAIVTLGQAGEKMRISINGNTDAEGKFKL